MNSEVIKQIIKDLSREKILRAALILSGESMDSFLERAYSEAGDPAVGHEENASAMTTWMRSEVIYLTNAL